MLALGATLVTVSPAAAALAVESPPFAPATPLASGDFDGDGRDDLAIGAPREDIAANADAGAVNVLYGSSTGLGSARNQFWHQGVTGVPGALEAGDGFGWALTAGDFDNDGYDDLAIGVPMESLLIDHDTTVIYGRCCAPDWRERAGVVNVLYGGPNGLATARAKVWHQGKSGVKGKPQKNDYFGSALAAGDFDGDRRDDLAVGVPGEDRSAGVVQILFGAAAGLSSRDQLVSQDTSGVDDVAERDDAFGASLAAGNLGYSTKEEDLAIGVPAEDLGALRDAGAVNVLYGQPGKGLSATLVPDLFLNQDGASVDESAAANEFFGWALAIGDFGRLAQGDLAVGVPGETVSVDRQGAVQVFYGSSYGVTVDGQQLWGEGIGGLGGVPESADELGRSLVASDFNGFSQADLAMGVPYEDVDGALAPNAGAVHVVYGSGAGLLVTPSRPAQLWNRTLLANGIAPIAGDLFGFALAAGSFRGEQGTDLAVSAPKAANVGIVHVLEGTSPTGLGALAAQIWQQNSPGIADTAEAGDLFGGG